MMTNVPQFLTGLQGIDAKAIEEDRIARVQEVLLRPRFSPAEMETISSAAANLCRWVVNIVSYNRVFQA